MLFIFQWRLRMLWQHLIVECGFEDSQIDGIWKQIESAVVKTILCALPEMRNEFKEMVEFSAYNTYKILGKFILNNSTILKKTLYTVQRETKVFRETSLYGVKLPYFQTTSVMREFSASWHFFKTNMTQSVAEFILYSQKTRNCGYFLSNLAN